jgi:hypothetical protein
MTAVVAGEEQIREGSFQDRREYVPVAFGKNILLFTILKRPLPNLLFTSRAVVLTCEVVRFDDGEPDCGIEVCDSPNARRSADPLA